MISQEIKNSTQLRRAWYDTDKKELIIEFARGVKYIYFNVPPEVYTNLVAAPRGSIYFNENIKGVYEYKKL
jgi:hypothetical protein